MEESEFFRDLITVLGFMLYFGVVIYKNIHKKKHRRPSSQVATSSYNIKSIKTADQNRKNDKDTTPQPMELIPIQVTDIPEEEGSHAVDIPVENTMMSNINMRPRFSPRRRALRQAMIWSQILKPKY